MQMLYTNVIMLCSVCVCVCVCLLVVKMSSDRGPTIYGLESQGRSLTARTLAARAGETDNIHFVVGTQSLRQENQVHLLEYCDDTGVLDKTVYPFSAGELWYVRVRVCTQVSYEA